MKNLTVLKQYLWIINIGVITISVYLTTDILFTYLKNRLAVPYSSFSPQSEKKTTNAQKKNIQYYSIIQERNIFNSSPVKEVDPTAEAQNDLITKIASEEYIIEITDLRLKLLGTILWDKERSRAIIESLNTKKQDIYKIGDIIEGAEIIDIERNKALLNNKGRIETLLSFEKQGKGDKRSDTSKRRRGKGKSSSIQSTGKNRWDVPRKEIDKTLSNMNRFMTQAMLRPHFENGKPAGFRIDRIKNNSLIEQIGLKNGDIIKSVNGLSIDSPEKAFEVYRQMKNESQIKLDLKRGGKVEQFNYTIR